LLVEAFHAAWISGTPSLRGAAVLAVGVHPGATASIAVLGLRERPGGSRLACSQACEHHIRELSSAGGERQQS